MPVSPIIVIDDAPDFAEVVALLLTINGIGCAQTFTNSSAALFRLREMNTRPALVIANIAMPYLGGLALITAARKRFPALPAILMTGNQNLIGVRTCGVPVLVKGTWGFVASLLQTAKAAVGHARD